MDQKRKAKWQQGASAILEPGEQVLAAAPGQKAEGMSLMTWIVAFVESVAELFLDWVAIPLPSHGRAYLVTDRNVYFCRLSPTDSHKVDELLEKRPVTGARMEFRRNRLTLDGVNAVYVGWLPVGRRWAREVAEAANAGTRG
jgi:hypothetical protein